jgi:predicted permease
MSIVTALLFGVLPAIQAARSSVGEALKEGAAAVTGSRAARRAQSGLVAVQIALALVLTTSAGLLFRSFAGMLQVEPGFEVEGLTVLSLELNDQYQAVERVAFTEQLLEILRRTPGVDAATAGVTLPFTRTGGSRCCYSTRVEGSVPLPEESEPRFFIQPVSDEYFATLTAPLIGGREFMAADAREDAPVAVLNASAARTLFGTENVVGRTIELEGELTVIGVEADLHHWGLNQPPENNVYVPYRQVGGDFSMLNVAVRSELPLEALAPVLREAVWALEPNLPIGSIQTMEQQVSGSLAAPRFLAFLFGVFACVSLLLACSGVYSSMLYAVGQRTREMGIRYAVGASAREIVAMVLRSGLGVALLGAVGGLLASAAASKVIGAMLWNVAPRDPLTYLLSAAVLGGTTLLACLVPALKAARADPLRALRSE